jgi:ABC-type transport system involved in cytochrome bd biosynthesis fused ATPase/permease subunit
MESLRNVLIGVCFGWLVAGVVNMLAPDGGIGRTLRLTLSVFTLVVLILPFAQQVSSVPTLTFSVDSFVAQPQEELVETMKKSAEEEVKALVALVGKQQNVSVEITNIDVMYREQKIWISAVDLRVQGTPLQANAVKNELERYIDGTITVAYTKENRE